MTANKDDLVQIDPDELEALNTIIAGREAKIRRIPESTFIERLLPILMSNELVDKRYWFEVTGGELLPVDVVNSNTGEIMFRVPSLVPSYGSPTKGRTMYDIISTAAQKHRVMPPVAEKYLNNELDQYFQRSDKTAPNGGKSDAEMWKFIYSTYVEPRLVEKAKQEDKAAGKVDPTEEAPLFGVGETSDF